MTHELKCWTEYYAEIVSGRKTFEVRKNDRNFRIRDILVLKEYDHTLKEYTGQELYCSVTYILYGGEFGINEGWVVMSIRKLDTSDHPF